MGVNNSSEPQVLVDNFPRWLARVVSLFWALGFRAEWLTVSV
jgi:hypothetical protein